ncbi:MAG TPA: fibronectin type III domain-containing protein [Thermoanaerobaculaceae bacterium]|nr:fibronectin type III domain-containing protein [Thermoanaerobaculaceae bacterium]
MKSAFVVLAGVTAAAIALLSWRPAAAAIPDSERQALLDLFASTNGPGWTKSTNWNGAPGTECSWFGIVCTGDGNAVKEINLNGNSLVGSIPVSLANLTSLTHLNLGMTYLGINRLSGGIPPQLANLHSLTALNLGVNLLSGSIPSELGSLTNLVYLDLGMNQLTGAVPPQLGNLTSLTYLNLGANQLNGTVPSEIGNLAGLVELELYRNELTGPIPQEMGNLTSLQRLILYQNQLSGPIPVWLASLTGLREISLWSNQLEGPVPQEIGNLTGLMTLELSDNRLTGSIPRGLGSLTNLEVLWLGGNQLSGTIPAELGGLTNLRDLNLTSAGLQGTIPVEFGNLLALEGLYLDFNSLTGSIPPQLGGLRKLRNLHLGSNHLSGPIPPELGELVNLEALGLGENQLTGTIPTEIGNLTGLWWLWLQSNQLLGEVPSTITNLTSLFARNSAFGWNGLHSSDPVVVSFLNSRDETGDWQSTQTIPVTGLAAAGATPSSVTLTWAPIVYTADGGGYEVYYATKSGGPYALSGTTADKSAASWTVSGLAPDSPYWFIVKSVTDPHAHNQNVVVSDPSVEIGARTAPAPPPPAISAAERQALMDLYASAGGTGWRDAAGWGGESGSECGWYGVVCDATDTNVVRLLLNGDGLAGCLPATLGNMASLQELDLSSNGLTGPIPAELGGLVSLTSLRLGGNDLTGALPPELSTLARLQTLDLSANRLSGPVPPAIGSLTVLRLLDLGDNAFSGAIPAAIGNLTGLHVLGLASNRLVGAVPATVANLVNLASGRSAFGWNGLHTSDAGVAAFLSDKQTGGDWQGTQTAPVAGVTAGPVTSQSVTLAWVPIRYVADAGAYRVYVATQPGGPYTLGGTTDDKSAPGWTVAGLTPDTVYYLVVTTFTEANANNRNAVESDPSDEVAARTSPAESGGRVRRHLKHAP